MEGFYRQEDGARKLLAKEKRSFQARSHPFNLKLVTFISGDNFFSYDDSLPCIFLCLYS